jgi:hypothetical protein
MCGTIEVNKISRGNQGSTNSFAFGVVVARLKWDCVAFHVIPFLLSALSILTPLFKSPEIPTEITQVSKLITGNGKRNLSGIHLCLNLRVAS